MTDLAAAPAAVAPSAADVDRLADRVWRLLLAELRQDRLRGHPHDRPLRS